MDEATRRKHIMKNLLFPVMAGIFISLQSVFNARASEKIGFWETNTFVHGTGFIITVIMLFISGSGGFSKIGEVNKLYLTGGVLGALIVYTVTKGITSLGAALAVAVLLATQLIVATVIDTFGLFGSTPVKFDYTKLIGLLMMIGGIIVFKSKG